MKKKIAILILAAGSSSRMGKIKQLLPFKNTTLLGNAIATATEISDTIFVVLGANAATIKPHIPKNVNLVYNEAWEKGMGTSIKAGVAKTTSSGHFNGILIMVADQPLISINHYQNLIFGLKSYPNQISATGYENRAGVPAIFPNVYFEKLLAFDQDFGARHLLNANSEKVIRIATTDNLMDIDTPENYQLLQKMVSS